MVAHHGRRLRLRKHDDLKVWRSMELRRTSRRVCHPNGAPCIKIAFQRRLCVEPFGSLALL